MKLANGQLDLTINMMITNWFCIVGGYTKDGYDIKKDRPSRSVFFDDEAQNSGFPAENL